MIKDDQHSQTGEDPLALMRQRHLIAVSLVAALALAGVLLLFIGLYIEHVYTWTGGIGCILSGVGIAVYAGQVDTARLALQQQTRAASQDGAALEAVLDQLGELAAGVVRLNRQQAQLAERLANLAEDELRERRRRSG